jgi:lysosomal acid lipase/cholesteryl ester hydrolase
MFPRIFKGWEDGEIDDLRKPMVRSRNAKDIVENAPCSAGRYRLEEYAVFTPDGYIVILHRLVFARKEGEVGQVRQPVLLNHGAMMTSEAWLTAPVCAEEAIPLTLAHFLLHNNYDVWLMNRRGNKYSCKHTSLSTHSPEFWSFSLDEPACRDLPAVIDFVRAACKTSRVGLVAFSQGAAEVLAALSIVSDLEEKVSVACLLAPTTRPRTRSFRASVIRTVVKLSPEVIFLFFGRKVMLSFVPFWQRVLSPKTFVYFLDTSMRWMFGWHCENISQEAKIVYYQHLFAYTSVKQIVHWFQIMRAKRFQMFDEGPSVKVASGHLPPAYPLHQIKTPLVLFEGTADSLRDSTLQHLPALHTRHCLDGYEHLDFMWADSVSERVWPEILRVLQSLHRAEGSRTAPISPPPERSEVELIEAFKVFLKTHRGEGMTE